VSFLARFSARPKGASLGWCLGKKGKRESGNLETKKYWETSKFKGNFVLTLPRRISQMKLKLFSLALLFCAPFARGEEAKVETLADTLNITGSSPQGGMGAPVVKYANIMGKNGTLTGGRGAWIVDHTYMIGGFGYGLTTEREMNGNDIGFGYGGILVGYSLWSDRLVHPVFMANLGWGRASSNSRDNNNDPIVASNISVIEPEMLVETNLFKHARLAVGGSYRIVTGVKDNTLRNRDFAGWSLTSAVNFGVF